VKAGWRREEIWPAWKWTSERSVDFEVNADAMSVVPEMAGLAANGAATKCRR
jgi:hypothetical protein